VFILGKPIQPSLMFDVQPRSLFYNGVPES
jgi:hypothetical protein